MRTGALGLVLAMLLSLAMLACGGGEEEPTPLDVSLSEWSIETSAEVIEPGSVIFEVTNTGMQEHELVIIKSDFPPEMLELDGARVDESLVNIVARTATLAAGASETLELDLTAGKFVLICNLVDEGEDEGHYQKGMATSLLVER